MRPSALMGTPAPRRMALSASQGYPCGVSPRCSAPSEAPDRMVDDAVERIDARIDRLRAAIRVAQRDGVDPHPNFHVTPCFTPVDAAFSALGNVAHALRQVCRQDCFVFVQQRWYVIAGYVLSAAACGL